MRSQTSANSISGSSPSVRENRTRGALSVRISHGEAPADCGPHVIPRLWAASPHCVVEGVGSWSPIGLEGGYAPISLVSRMRTDGVVDDIGGQQQEYGPPHRTIRPMGPSPACSLLSTSSDSISTTATAFSPVTAT